MVRRPATHNISSVSVPRASGDGPVSADGFSCACGCSPRERGWSHRRDDSRPPASVFPARAGMVPGSSHSADTASRVPRASGDGPCGLHSSRLTTACSPRERGWSQLPTRSAGSPHVFPARAGMVPRDVYITRARARVPRASGDGPIQVDTTPDGKSCSPRERGWSARLGRPLTTDEVFPARAGMVPQDRATQDRLRRVPRASGDGPRSPGFAVSSHSCSPRERGWSLLVTTLARGMGVFPARAGMVPGRSCGGRSAGCVPRASGDGPAIEDGAAIDGACSPRERGWSPPHRRVREPPRVFPARAGMVRSRIAWLQWHLGVPRASGDGPPRPASYRQPSQCSPRERGWSHQVRDARRELRVFPARAGMVPDYGLPQPIRRRVPRASGDGPELVHLRTPIPSCSPRERGWSRTATCTCRSCCVFPARAGMVPRRTPRLAPLTSVPRASGDGPALHQELGVTRMCSPRERGWSQNHRGREGKA